MAHVGVEEDVIRGQCLRPQLRPGLRHLQPDGGQLPGQRLHRGVRAVQDDRLRAAKVRNADRPALHDTTRKTGVGNLSGRA
jgi:hypothetical protein